MAATAEVYENRAFASTGKQFVDGIGRVLVGENGRINGHSRNRQTNLDGIGDLTGLEGM
jgi:hypothetical protein